MKDLLSHNLIASLISEISGHAIVDPTDLKAQYSAFTNDLYALVDEKCPIIRILRRLTITSVELSALQGYFDKEKKKCAQPYFSG